MSKRKGGPTEKRAEAIFDIGKYDGFPVKEPLLQWLQDKDDRVSRAAAIALISMHPKLTDEELVPVLQAKDAVSRKNVAWAIGMIGGEVSEPLLAALRDQDERVLQETLLALSRCDGEVSADILLPFLHHPSRLVAGAAALALARHQPDVAAQAIGATLGKEEEKIAEDYADYVRRGKPTLTQQEIDSIVLVYRGEMKMVQAFKVLPDRAALSLFEQQAFRAVEDSSRVTGLVAGYQLWDRIGADPQTAIRALGDQDSTVANRAEWMLIEAGPVVLPAVRMSLMTEESKLRRRCIEILAWQGDRQSLAQLKDLADGKSEDAELARWAVDKIRSLSLENVSP